MINFDYSKLNFKLDRPQPLKNKPKQQEFLQETQISHNLEEEYTPNPYRHSYHLWKYINKNYETNTLLKNDNQCHLKTINKQIQDKDGFLQNFDSFQDQVFNQQIQYPQDKQQIKFKQGNSYEYKLSPLKCSSKFDRKLDFIRVEQSQYSLIEDDLNAEIGFSDLFEKEKVRAKTQAKEDIFFLTNQNKNQTGVKQFYFNLNTNQSNVCSQIKTKRQEPKKMQVKKLVYAFIDDLENVKENEINANFIGELKEYLNVGIPQHKMTKSFLYCEAKNESKKLTERKVGKQNNRRKSTKKRWV